MAKSSPVFICRECGGESIRWAGQCPHCRAWNTLEEFQVARGGRDGRRVGAASAAVPTVIPITEVELDEASRLPPEGGELGRGVGLAETDLDGIVAALEVQAPALAVVDSIQTVMDSAVDATPGSVSQVREGAARLMRLAKASGVPIALVGHVTKEGAIAGPRVLEHMVDTVLYLEGERGQEFRILRANKNRFGSTEEIGIFTMTAQGMEEVSDPSAALIGDLRAVPGTAVLAAMAGRRPLLVELQSLVSRAAGAIPRRVANGIDLNR